MPRGLTPRSWWRDALLRLCRSLLGVHKTPSISPRSKKWAPVEPNQVMPQRLVDVTGSEPHPLRDIYQGRAQLALGASDELVVESLVVQRLPELAQRA
jgi:hypothetical protein